MSIRIHGIFDTGGAVKRINKKLKNFRKDATDEGLEEAGRHLLSVSEYYTPEDTGRLKRSIYYRVVKFFGQFKGLQFGANDPRLTGDDKAPYAPIVHNDLTRNYKPHSGRDVGPRYLSRTLDASRTELPRIIGKYLRKSLRGK